MLIKILKRDHQLHSFRRPGQSCKKQINCDGSIELENGVTMSPKRRSFLSLIFTGLCFAKLLLIHLTETRRRAVDSGLVVAVAFVDFKKALDSVYHTVLETELERDFGIIEALF